MESIRKKTFTKPLPPNAEVVVVTSATYVAKYRDGSAIIHNEQSRPAAETKEPLDQSWPSWNAARSWSARES